MIKRLRKLANVFKPNKFHYALVDYLAEELKSNNISCRKKTSYIKIKLANIVEDKYEHLIIDCFNGGIYLRGNEVKDKKILKLNRFYGDRESDAMYCAHGGTKQILKYIESLNVTNELTVEASKKKVIDMRKNIINNKTKDMRKIMFNNLKNKTCYNDILDINNENIYKITTKRLKKNSDLKGRDFAIAIINGDVFSGDTHGEAITNYLNEIGIKDISVYDRDELESIMGYGFKNQFAAAHVKDDVIYIEPETLENISLDEAANLINHKYPGFKIINVDTNERIAKLNNIEKTSRLKKISKHNDSNRDSAIIYINGQFYEGVTHAQAINKYFESNDMKKLNDDFFRPGMLPDEFVMETGTENQKEDIQTMKSIEQMAFAHKVEKEKAIYIENDSLQNIDLITAGQLFKQNYPDYDIYNDDSYEEENKDEDIWDLYFKSKNESQDSNNINQYQKIARLKKIIDTKIKKFSRLKKINRRDLKDRDEDGAIVYIDGEVLQGETHGTAINKYIEEKTNNSLNDKYYRPYIYSPNVSTNPDDYSWGDVQDVETVKENIKQIAFAHIVSTEGNIYIERDTLQNIDVNAVAKAIKEKYPEYNICLDETDEIIAKLKNK